jgi:hypothetical protein
MGVRGVSPDYDKTQHAHAQNKAKRSGQAKRSGETGFGGHPRKRQFNSHARRRRPGRAQRPFRAQGRRGVWGLTRLRCNAARPRAEERKPSAAARPSAAEKGGSGSPSTTTAKLARTPKKAKRSAAAWPGATGKRGSGNSSDYGYPPYVHAEEGHAEHSGQAEPGRDGGVGCLPRLRQNTARPRVEDIQAQRPGRARRKIWGSGSPPAMANQLTSTPKKAKLSAAARPSAAEKWGSGSHPTTI